MGYFLGPIAVGQVSTWADPLTGYYVLAALIAAQAVAFCKATRPRVKSPSNADT